MNALVDLALGQAKVPVVSVDEKNTVLSANESFEKLSGFKVEQLLGKSLNEVMYAYDWDLLSEHPEKPGKKAQEAGPYYLIRHAEGNDVPVRLETIELSNGELSNGELSSSDLAEGDPPQGKSQSARLHFVFDCSELEALITDNLHDARLASMGRFLSGIIHEISNPLAVISGCAQILNLKKLPPEIEEDVKLIYDESKRTAELVGNVLSYARKKNDKKERFKIQDVVEEATRLKQHSLRKNGIALRHHHEYASPLLAHGYKVQMMQVILNLINNAEQAIQDQAIQDGGAAGGKIAVSTGRLDGKAVISIEDNGPGVPEKERSHIFDAFFTTKKGGKGTGLGLYLSRKIIRKFGGDLELVDSPMGQTAFRINLPLLKKNESAAEDVVDNEMMSLQ